MNKENLLEALKLFGQLIVVSVLNFFICISFLFICTAVFTDEAGYTATVYDKEKNQVEQYVYYFENGEDMKAAQYPEADGFSISKQTIRGELNKTGNTVFRVVTQIFTLALFAGFIYPKLWQLGARDSNAVKFKRREYDPLRGLKIGALAQIPAAALLIALLTAWRSFPVKLYALLNCSFYSVIDIIGANKSFGQLGVAEIIVLFALIIPAPAIAAGAYWLGIRDISLSERFVYKKQTDKK